MNLALFAALFFAVAAEAKLGQQPSFAEQVSFLEKHSEGGQPAYCYPKSEAADYGCYKDGYPKCCTKDKGNCPNDVSNKPGCECEPGTCGGQQPPRGVNCSRGDGKCKGNTFCKIPGGTCSNGRCENMTTGCDRSLKQVCGCNGATYDNECEAFSVGVSVDYDGACGDTGTPSPTTPAPTRWDYFPDGGRCERSCTKNRDCQTTGGFNPCPKCGNISGTVMYQRCYAPEDFSSSEQ